MNEAFRDLCAGTVAGVAGILATQPLDIIRVRLQTQAESGGHHVASMRQTARILWQSQGLAGFFRGMAAPLVANAPINAVVFSTERAAAKWLRVDAGEGSSLALRLLAGALSGLAQLPFSIPAELVKVQLQVDHGPREPYTSSLHCARSILREHGPSGLFRGGLLTAARDTSAFAIYFACYYEMKTRLLELQRRRRGALGLGLAAPAAGAAAAAKPSTAAAASAASAAAAPSIGDGFSDSADAGFHIAGGGCVAACERCSGYCDCEDASVSATSSAASSATDTASPLVLLSASAAAPGSTAGPLSTAVASRATAAMSASSAAGGAATAGVVSTQQPPPTLSAAPRWATSLLLSPALALMVSGGTAGVASWALTYPIDTAKSLVQGLPLSTDRRARSLRAVLAANLKEEGGYSFLFRGFGATMARAFMNSAVVFSVFELCVSGMDKHFAPRHDDA